MRRGSIRSKDVKETGKGGEIIRGDRKVNGRDGEGRRE